ncbi:MAG: alpha/beta hydrolase [Hyphomicrobiaceae bacterium]
MADEQPYILELDDAVHGRRRIATLKQAGRGPTVVWLQGFMSDMASTKASALAEWAGRTGQGLLRLDYSGHGRSSGRIEEGCIGLWLEDARQAVARLTEGPLLLVGSSMGGWIGLLLARELQLEDRLAGLVLIAPAWDMTERLMWDEMSADQRREVIDKGIWYEPSVYSDQGYPITRRLIEEGRDHAIGGTGLRLEAPVHILQGMRDADVPWRGSLALVDLLSGGDVRLTLVKDGDHRLSRPEDIALLLSVIKGIGGR